jgi:hypothetical protein
MTPDKPEAVAAHQKDVDGWVSRSEPSTPVHSSKGRLPGTTTEPRP